MDFIDMIGYYLKKKRKKKEREYYTAYIILFSATLQIHKETSYSVFFFFLNHTSNYSKKYN